MHYRYEVMVRLTVRARAQPAIAICEISSIYYGATFIPGQLKICKFYKILTSRA